MSNTSILRFMLSLPLCIVGCVGVETGSSELPPKRTDRFGERLKELGTESRTSTGGVYHRVAKGETLARIARSYGVGRAEIAQANNLADENKLKIGQRLFIPGARGGKTNVASGPRRSSRSGGRFIWPLDGRVISRFDPRQHNTGIKISAVMGQKVRAAKGGVVAQVAENANGWGKVVIIDHGDGFSTWYAHNSRIVVKKGDRVKQGDTIAEAGRTGRVNRPQLSFRILKGANPVDPLKYLPR